MEVLLLGAGTVALVGYDWWFYREVLRQRDEALARCEKLEQENMRLVIEVDELRWRLSEKFDE